MIQDGLSTDTVCKNKKIAINWQLHNTMAIYLLYKAEKPSVCPSVRLCHRIISVVSVWIDLGLALCISEVFKTCIDVFSST